MGAALYPVLEHPIKGLKPALEVSGKALARNDKALEELCKRLGVRPIMDFYSESKEETTAHLGEEPDEELSAALDKIPLEWYDPAEGLMTARALLQHLATQTATWVQGVIEDLQSLERVLAKAQQANTRFRLCIDM